MIYQIRKHVAFLFLFLISLFIVPKEYIHDLAGHKDTVCHFHFNTTIEKPHHHCAILNFNAPLYLTAISCELSAVSYQLNIFYNNDYSFNYIDLINLSSLRAPPIS